MHAGVGEGREALSSCSWKWGWNTACWGGLAQRRLGVSPKLSLLLAGLSLCLSFTLWSQPRGLSAGTRQSLAWRGCPSPSGNVGSGLSQTVSTQDAFPAAAAPPQPSCKNNSPYPKPCDCSPEWSLSVQWKEWRWGLPALNRPRGKGALGRLESPLSFPWETWL